MIKRFVDASRSGWYLRVLEPGAAETTEPIILSQRDPAGITVRQAFDAALGRLSRDDIAAVYTHPALAPAWLR